MIPKRAMSVTLMGVFDTGLQGDYIMFAGIRLCEVYLAVTILQLNRVALLCDFMALLLFYIIPKPTYFSYPRGYLGVTR